MGLEEKVPVAHVGDAAVDDGPLLGALGPRVDVVGIGRVEARLVALHRHDERHPWLRVRSSWVRL